MILITGASGRIGRRAAELLHAEGQPLRLMSRNRRLSVEMSGVEVVFGDFEDEASLREPFKGISTALIISGMALPGKRALTHRNTFRAAANAGVEHIVYLSLRGSSPTSLFPYCRDHFTSEEFLVEVKVPYTSLRIGFYMDMFLDKIDAKGVLRGPAGEHPGAFLSREDAAQAAAQAAIRQPGGRPEITGPELLSFEDVARELSLATGKQLQYEDETYEDMRLRLSHAGLPEWVQELEVSWREAFAAGEQAPVTDGFNRLVGHAPLTLLEYFSRFPALTKNLAVDAPPLKPS
ncbi:MAG: NAD(P)H-binding protein [Acidobacteriaceae bacterium]